MSTDIALQIATYTWSLFVVPFVTIYGFWLIKRLIFDK